ncbi:MAG TPA: hypothetical protein PKC43_02975 [Phycisphaerales bacterium]|nr:hypothetical protein [Phycisphaerales bacterium]HMP36390.1 hypothetical protein [Phycisphaerales bacterium]
MAAALLWLGGCAAVGPAPEAANGSLAALAEGTASAGSLRTTPLGSLVTDRFTLPLVAPDGHTAAAMVGVPASWTARLGLPGDAALTEDSVVVFFIAPDEPPVRTAIVEGAVVIGRSATVEGFLVEAPRRDGSRDIGLADWIDGSVAWLRSDGAVNAMATIGPGGALAWCRRAPTARSFELVFADRGREVVVPPPERGTWLLPTFSADGSRLFAFIFREGDLHLASIRTNGTAPRVYEAGLIAPNASVVDAYQSISAVDGALPGPGQPGDAFLFHLVREGRAAIWFDDDRRLVTLPRGSLAVAYAGPESIVVSLRDGIVRQTFRPNIPAARLFDRLALWRPQRGGAFESILLLPVVGGVDLLGLGGAAPASRAPRGAVQATQPSGAGATGDALAGPEGARGATNAAEVEATDPARPAADEIAEGGSS